MICGVTVFEIKGVGGVRTVGKGGGGIALGLLHKFHYTTYTLQNILFLNILSDFGVFL